MTDDLHLRDMYVENFPGIAYVARIDFVPLLFEGSVQEITGYTSEEFLKGNPRWDQIIFREDLDDEEKGFESIRLRPNTKLDREYRIRRKDGSVRWIHDVIQNICDPKGVPFRVAGTLLDITNRKTIEANLREREARLQSVFRAAPVGIGVLSDRIILDVNQTLCDMLGYASGGLVGQDTRTLYATEEEFDRVRLELCRQMQECGTGTVETWWLQKEGSLIEVLLSASPIDPTHLRENVTFTALDITERRRAEEDRQRLQQQILHSQKLESLGVLAGGIAHDFNNLLTGILGNASLAMMDLDPSSPVREMLGDIEQASLRAADLCRQMLAYSGKGKFVIERVNVTDLVREMAHLLKISISKRALLRYDFFGSLPDVEADATQLRQIVMNLITNASEALGDLGGIIRVSTGVLECDKDDLGATYVPEDIPEGLYVFIEVADSGCGMDEETKLKIFDPFFSTKFTGRGLGLSAVLGIVRGHKGAIKIQTELGKGSTFRVLLPAAQEASILEKRTSCPVSPLPVKNSGLLLLIDDEESVRAVGKRMFERLGFQVLLAADGREALEVFRERHREVVCVILDLTMPHMGGEECFEALRRIRPEVPVLLSSGYNEQDVTQRFTGKGLAGFIKKPYTLDILSQKLSDTLFP